MDMRMRWRTPVCLILCGILLWLLADAAGSRAAVEEALALCGRSVIPSLFPFMTVSTLLLSMGFGDLAGPLLAGLMEPLFRVDGAGSAALVLGLVGGYPIGPRTAAALCRDGRLSLPEGERLLTFCNNSNPVFLISVLGIGVFGSLRTGVWLWLIHVAAALLTGVLFRRAGGDGRRRRCAPSAPAAERSLPRAFAAAVESSLGGMLSVCAFVIFFYVLARPLSRVGGRAGCILVGLTELFSLTPLLTADRFGFILAAAMAGWGGLSVLCQTAASLEGSGLRLRFALAGKAVQGLFSAALAAALSGYVLG